MASLTLAHVALFLAAAAIAAPLAKALRIGTVLGYLIAGILIGPYGLGALSGFGIDSLYEAQEVLHFAEFGVVLLLFLIGLELRLPRLWTMRAAIFGAGGAQVAITGVLLGVIGWSLGLAAGPALFMGLALALSSTAFALQVMEENKELTTRHGRVGFAVLLFQDLAAIPLIALASLFAVSKAATGSAVSLFAIAKAILVIGGIVIVGRFVIDRFFALVARSKLHEAMTASALLVVIVVVLAMGAAGLSASLGAFLAGVLLADSAFRHEIEADIKPFEGLLLGLFFTAIGMSLDLKLLAQQPGAIVGLVLTLLLVKAAVLYGIGRWQGLDDAPSRRLAGSLSQGGEFAFVLFGAGAAAGVLTPQVAALGVVIVTLSMMATPAVLALDTALGGRKPKPQPLYDTPPDTEQHVIVAGLGRFGQIVSRVLRARKIPITALDIDAEHIEAVRKFGNKIYFGDASRQDILEAAQTGKARAFVLAIDDVEASIRTAEIVRRLFPEVPILARARNRNHVHRLMDLGVTVIHRETYAAALELTHDLLRELGSTEADARRAIEMFRAQDERRLIEAYQHYTNDEKLLELALKSAQELERQFEADAVETAIAEGEASRAPRKPAAAVREAAE
jgi:glutathione-regulated potassium-efflux system protein KefB